MAHKKRGHITVSGEWAKHLRNKKKKLFWKGERNAGKELVRIEVKFEGTGDRSKQ
ncbi:hypothetical protein Q4534_01540 [Cyclobacterium sp. 1_MG-2023]|uniref:hypothetical protein n=1 Tax=Cyclobacterium sp. 1_MG-2023 TaxID=3062681 RepID=UPI0026E3839E|nr:hypothetical protein [Cyclobacterium sp. 1_MG-2023]MDO6436064.1 hypothetical protein [Cyclobacterium sp. 1_MG-2023]